MSPLPPFDGPSRVKHAVGAQRRSRSTISMIIGTIKSDAIQPPLEPFAVEGLFVCYFSSSKRSLRPAIPRGKSFSAGSSWSPGLTWSVPSSARPGCGPCFLANLMDKTFHPAVPSSSAFRPSCSLSSPLVYSQSSSSALPPWPLGLPSVAASPL